MEKYFSMNVSSKELLLIESCIENVTLSTQPEFPNIKPTLEFIQFDINSHYLNEFVIFFFIW